MNLRKLYHWVRKTSKGWDGLTRHFLENVVVFSRAVVKAQSSQIRKIAEMAGGKAESQRRRIQRFISQKQDLGMFFKAWTRSVIQEVKQKQVVLIVDETKLRDKIGIMVVGLAFEGRCIPLAWRVYYANSSEDYPQEGQANMILVLLKQVQQGMPKGVTVRLLADRGIGTSPALMRGVMEMGWTFLFRVTKQSKIVFPDGEAVCFYDQVKEQGERYDASGLVFKKRGLVPAHVRVLWREGGQEPWSLVTNDPDLDGYEYAERMWIEEAFRDLKSYGWRLEQAAEMLPERLERLMLFLVVAYGWMLIVGRAVVANGLGMTPKKREDGTTVRRLSLFREGRRAYLSASSFG
jgi:hypothetical protein